MYAEVFRICLLYMQSTRCETECIIWWREILLVQQEGWCHETVERFVELVPRSSFLVPSSQIPSQRVQTKDEKDMKGRRVISPEPAQDSPTYTPEPLSPARCVIIILL